MKSQTFLQVFLEIDVFFQVHHNLFQDCNQTFQMDIILDNAGYELVTDLVLSFWVLKTLPSTNIALHCKHHPWFVSDATCYDVTWTLHQGCHFTVNRKIT